MPYGGNELALKRMDDVSEYAKTNPWAQFYGPAPYISDDMLPTNQGEKTIAADLPRAYQGENIYISTIIQELVLFADNWYTKVACPIEIVEKLDYEVHQITFDAHLPRDTPHKAPSRIVHYSQSSKSGSLIRRGIAYEMEGDFMNTTRGQEIYKYTLNQIANAMIAMINIGVIMAYMECDNYEIKYNESKGIRTFTDIIEKTRREIQLWAIIQKQKNGVKKLDSLVSGWMEKWGGQANMWIMPPMIKQWLDFVPPENTDFYLTGRPALAVEDSMRPVSTVNGVAVYLCRVYDGVTELGTRSLLESERSIGSYYTMFDLKLNAPDYYRKYKSQHRSILVYDENKDNNEELSIDFALENIHGVFDRDGNAKKMNQDPMYGNSDDMKYDMLTRVDPETRRPAPIQLFGHIREEHFDTQSLNNLCTTVINALKRTSDYNAGKMEQILTDGLNLSRAIGELDIKREWFFNVFIQRVIDSGYNGTLDFRMGDDGDEAFKNFMDTITTSSKRSSIPLRVLTGSPFKLPEFNYFANIPDIHDYFSSNSREDLKNTPFTFQELKTLLKDGSKGGSTPGALAGYSTYDGLLALKNEYVIGGGEKGFTKNGYSLSYCQTASQFVDLIKTIAQQLAFIFDNDVYLNQHRASSVVEIPTREHVVAESILGINGLPVWLNTMAIGSFYPAGRKDRLNDDPKGDILKILTNVIQDNDVDNYTKFADLINSIGKDFSKDQVKSGDLVARLTFYFNKLKGNSGWGKDDLENSKMNNSPGAKYLNRIHPFNNMDPHTMTFLSRAMRTIVLEVCTSIKNVSSSTKRKNLILDFIRFLDEKTGLGFLNTSNKAALNILNDVQGLSAINDDFVEKRLGQSRGLSFLDSLPNVYSVEFVQNLLEWIQTNANNLPNAGKLVGFVTTKFKEAAATDDELDTIPNPWARSIAFIPINQLDYPKKSFDDALREYFEDTSHIVNKEQPNAFIDAGIDQNRRFIEDGEGKSLLHENFFVRTPLGLSPRQIQMLKRIEKTERSNSGVQMLIHIRVSDPMNIDASLKPDQMAPLSKRIDKLNENSVDTMRMGRESLYLLHPENIEKIDRILAMSQSKILRQGGAKLAQSKKRKIPYGGFSSSSRYSKADRGDAGHRKRRRGLLSNVGVMDSDNEVDENQRYGSGAYDSDGDEMPLDNTDYSRVDLSSVRGQLGTETDDAQIDSNVIGLMIKFCNFTNSNLYKIIGKVYLTSKFNKPTLKKFISKDILLPLSFIVFQPHKTYRTFTCIKTQSGTETGVTYLAHSSLNLQNDAVLKMHFGHFTAYNQTVIKREQNVFRANAAFVAGCLGGAGTDPINPETYNPKEGAIDGSIIIVMVPYLEPYPNTIIDITGRFAVTGNFIDQNRANQIHYSQCWRTNIVWRFNSAARNLFSLDDSMKKLRGDNTVCVRAQQYNYNHGTKGFTDKVINQGHWGNEGPGDKEGREGGLTLLNRPGIAVDIGRNSN